MIIRRDWIEALKESEEKWETILNDSSRVFEFKEDCALCSLDQYTEENACIECPLEKEDIGCDKAPWRRIATSFRKNRLIAAPYFHKKHLEDIKQMLANIRSVREKYEKEEEDYEENGI
ncbi:MAG: hypothetical protein GY841_15840 [FCB group bacterium]|nr:hypothetical protein [FCB group bacterium]